MDTNMEEGGGVGGEGVVYFYIKTNFDNHFTENSPKFPTWGSKKFSPIPTAEGSAAQ